MPEMFSEGAGRELARDREAEIQDLETRIEKLTVEQDSLQRVLES